MRRVARSTRCRRACAALAGFVVVLGLASCNDDDARSDPTTSAAPDDDAPATTGGSTTVAPTAAEIVLRGDGLGVVDLGAAPDEAIAAVTAALGAPTADSGWEPSSGSYGTCPGDRMRSVEWDHLVLLFTDGETAYGSGEHLFTWRITGAPPALGTATGLGYDARVSDAEELYPGAVEMTDPEDPFPGFLTIAVDGGDIRAFLDGDVITNLEAGGTCGE